MRATSQPQAPKKAKGRNAAAGGGGKSPAAKAPLKKKAAPKRKATPKPKQSTSTSAAAPHLRQSSSDEDLTGAEPIELEEGNTLMEKLQYNIAVLTRSSVGTGIMALVAIAMSVTSISTVSEAYARESAAHPAPCAHTRDV